MSSLSHRGRSVSRWFLRRPSRIGVAAAVVLGLLLTVFGRAMFVQAGQARDAEALAERRSSCRSTVDGWSGDFFGADRDRDWPARVAQWVDPQLRVGVTAVDPQQVPTGLVAVEAEVLSAPRCDVWLRVDGPGGAHRLRVTAQQHMRGGWTVQSWEPVDDAETAPDGQAGP